MEKIHDIKSYHLRISVAAFKTLDCVGIKIFPKKLNTHQFGNFSLSQAKLGIGLEWGYCQPQKNHTFWNECTQLRNYDGDKYVLSWRKWNPVENLWVKLYGIFSKSLSTKWDVLVKLYKNNETCLGSAKHGRWGNSVKLHWILTQTEKSSPPVLVSPLGWFGVWTWLRGRGTAVPEPASMGGGRKARSTGRFGCCEFQKRLVTLVVDNGNGRKKLKLRS